MAFSLSTILDNFRGRGGTGIRARLRTVSRKGCGFNSHRPHHFFAPSGLRSVSRGQSFLTPFRPNWSRNSIAFGMLPLIPKIPQLNPDWIFGSHSVVGPWLRMRHNKNQKIVTDFFLLSEGFFIIYLRCLSWPFGAWVAQLVRAWDS